MKKYGYEIGMAFQIVDDILDFTGDPTKVGKPVATDLQQGLATLPVINYMNANPDDREMQAVLNGSKYNNNLMLSLVEKVRASGAIEESIGEAGQFVERAIDALADMPSCQERQALIEVASYIVSREL